MKIDGILGLKRDQPAQTRIVYADIFSDGRVLMNKTIQYRSHPGALFPKLPRDAAEAKALLAKAVEGLRAAGAALKNEELKADLAAKIAQHVRMEKHYLDGAERRAKILGKPAADFETTDLDGKKVKLADLRGQVVVL